MVQNFLSDIELSFGVSVELHVAIDSPETISHEALNLQTDKLCATDGMVV